MRETYYIGAYWGARGESAGACAQRLQAFLQALARVDPLFTRWFKPGKSRREALGRPLETEFEPLQQHIQRSIMRDDKRVPMESLGYSIWLWNGGSGSEDVGLNFLCGASSERVSNLCLLNPPRPGPGADRILTAPVLAQVLRCMAEAWDPDWGVAMSQAHRELIEKQCPDALVGWVTYLSRRRGRVPPLPAPIRIEPVKDLGALVILTPERFTASNPEHVALAERARELLARAGVLDAPRS